MDETVKDITISDFSPPSKLKTILIIVGIALVVLVGGGWFGLNFMVKMGLQKLGPKVLGAPIHVSMVMISPFNGKGKIAGFRMGNPPGFSEPNSMTWKNFMVELDVASLFKNPLVVHSVVIDQPEVTLEGSFSNNNFTAMQGNIHRNIGSSSDSDSGRRMLIHEFKVNDGKVHWVPASGGGGSTYDFDLPGIYLIDVGGSSSGVSGDLVLARVMSELTTGVLRGASTFGRGSAKKSVFKSSTKSSPKTSKKSKKKSRR